MTLGALLGGCFSIVPRERARTLGEGNVEASAGASVLADLDDVGGPLLRLGVDIGVTDTVDVGVRLEGPYSVLLRGQLQLLDSTRDAFDLSLHAGMGVGFFATVQGRFGVSVGHRLDVIEPWLSLTHSSVVVLGSDSDSDSDSDLFDYSPSDFPVLHMLQPSLGMRLHASERLKFDLHVNTLLPYAAPDRIPGILAGLDVGVVF